MTEQASDIVSTTAARAQTLISWFVEKGPEHVVGVGVIVGLFVGLRILRSILSGTFQTKKQDVGSFRNLVGSVIGATTSIFLLIASAALVVPFMESLPTEATGYLRTAFAVILIIQGAIWLGVIVARASSGYLERHPSTDGGPASTAASLIKTMSGIVIWALAAVMILTNLGFQVGPLIAGLGVGGLAIGLAAQSLFKDLFSALAIIFDRPFIRGDFITFDKGDYSGSVEKIGMKTTRLRSFTGEQIVISNSQLLDKEIKNFRRMNQRRAAFDVGVVYDTPHAALQKIPGLIEQAIRAVDGVTFDRSNFKAFGDSALVFETIYWIEDRDYAQFMRCQEMVLLGVHRAFEEQGLDFAFPTRTVHVVQDANAITAE
ncbi:MAG: mechanosensitive ion channel family protein [Pseudomonadota bacterium]